MDSPLPKKQVRTYFMNKSTSWKAISFGLARKANIERIIIIAFIFILFMDTVF